ncbi:MAG TPA: hypothetical protein VFH27_12570 [Longimicrobiaceae bacterium]|nr:hypothetical protein [Longimicrobiaceae bacterium]
MQLLTALLALLMEYHDDDECDCDGEGTCRHCLTDAALAEAGGVYPDELSAADRTWGRHLEARFAPVRVQVAAPIVRSEEPVATA